MTGPRANSQRAALPGRQFTLARLFGFVTLVAMVSSGYRAIPPEFYYAYSLALPALYALLWGTFLHKRPEFRGLSGMATGAFLIAMGVFLLVVARMSKQAEPPPYAAPALLAVGLGLVVYALFCFRRSDISDLLAAGLHGADDNEVDAARAEDDPA